ncbi:MAG: phosphatidylserine decarboxylase [Acidobacteria bacterium]|nr:phosphatidylserine decarboxylase [Acidobacteriota bacterium]
MVRDGYYYASGMAAAGLVVWWLAGPWFALAPLVLAVFFLQFFRDPERVIPVLAGAIVSPADGKVTDIATVFVNGRSHTRISIFLNVFDVHVNRSPIAGVVTAVDYRRGNFVNAMDAASAEYNEQNIVTVEGEGQRVVFKQIAGVLARRIVFTRTVGDKVARGERVGMIKFGSRVDVLLHPEVGLHVKIGDRVRGGADVLAVAAVAKPPAELVGAEAARG